MNRNILILFLCAVANLSALANVQGHFFLEVQNDNVITNNVEPWFGKWLDLPKNTTFTQFRDETDNLGIRHISYQQYVDGTKVNNGIILVHAKNNIVHTINGDIMDATIAAKYISNKITPLQAAKKIKKTNAKTTDAQYMIVNAYINGVEQYRYAYEVTSDDHTIKHYVDAETGEIIKSVPLVYNADVKGTAQTMYNGVQDITCYEDGGKYFLMDNARGIITLDATDNQYTIQYEKLSENDISTLTEEINNLIKGCSSIYNTSTTWTSTWNLQLKEFSISYVAQNDIWYTLGEGNADVYIKILDKDNNLLYTSEYYDDPDFPVYFNISPAVNLTTPPYVIQIWDHDPVGEDDYVDFFIINNIPGQNQTYPWSSYNKSSEGEIRIESYGKQPLLDAHWGMEKTLDFYKETFNRYSFDNKGSIVYQLVNQPSDTFLLASLPMNAFAINYQPFPMVYGMGKILSESNAIMSMNPLVSIDIMAHEFSHLVTDQNGNGGLTYLGESGALNESFSDIMGISVKKYATGHNDWLIGNDVLIYASNMRSMKNPNNSWDGVKPQPDTYNGTYWADITDNSKDGDNGGVHTNSGVQNYWFYLLSEGGSGTNDIKNTYNVKAIGIDKAVQIAYRNLIYYLTPNATYEDSRNGSIQAAIDLYGKGSQEHQSVVNAWYAVGVGEQYVAPDTEITISAIMPDDWGNTISAWVWQDGKEGQWANLQHDGQWWTYTAQTDKLNIVYVNGTNWTTDTNQSVDITVTENTCILLSNNINGKRTYTNIDCDDRTALTPHNNQPQNKQVTKIIENGKIYIILPDGRKYNTLGKLIK